VRGLRGSICHGRRGGGGGAGDVISNRGVAGASGKGRRRGSRLTRGYPGRAARGRVARSGGAKPDAATHRYRFYSKKIYYSHPPTLDTIKIPYQSGTIVRSRCAEIRYHTSIRSAAQACDISELMRCSTTAGLGPRYFSDICCHY
jgi:hypothetical protein